jgi:hypothetical protein
LTNPPRSIATFSSTAVAVIALASLLGFSGIPGSGPTTSSAPASQAAADDPNLGLIFPELPPEIVEGRTLAMRVKGVQGRPLRFRWFTKYGSEDWDWNAPWSDSSEYAFNPARPGRYDFQIDVMCLGDREPVVKKWLGTINVQGHLVESASYTPLITALPVGMPVRFVLRLRQDFLMEELEFRLWDLKPANQVVIDWQPWPLPAFRREKPGYTGLQIDIRLRHSKNVIDNWWLGNFYYFSEIVDAEANLIRNLIADNFAVMDRDAAMAILADELWLAAHLMLWEYRGLTLRLQEDHLAHLAEMQQMTHGRGDTLSLRLRSCREYDLNLAKHVLHQSGSPLSLDLSLAAMPAIHDVFKAMDVGSDREYVLAAMTYAVHAGFHYGTSTSIQYVDLLEDGVAHCGDRASLLFNMLDHQGVNALFVEVACAESGHILVLVRHERDGPLMLDPTTGLIYRFDAREWGKGAIPQPIVLPSAYHAGIRQLNQLQPKECGVRIFRDVIEGVYPLKPTDVEFSIEPSEAPSR